MKIKWHKLKLWEKHIVRRTLGAPIMGLATALSIVTYPSHIFNYDETIVPVAGDTVVVTTSEQVAYPVGQLTGISQGYHLLHPGIDLRAPYGSSVRAMRAGTVIEVKRMSVGYGHCVWIAHEGTLSTLYAHLDKIMVTSGQKVKIGEEIGTIGLTGWSTGPHLHFEAYEGIKTVNPGKYIEIKELGNRN